MKLYAFCAPVGFFNSTPLACQLTIIAQSGTVGTLTGVVKDLMVLIIWRQRPSNVTNTINTVFGNNPFLREIEITIPNGNVRAARTSAALRTQWVDRE